ncbi:hypothetical protein QFC22_001103 [Naganishia vaughanmartiniae]|uniref:Uncharacterized protein n=1 Tax=Naganishia vaughanmartiniae TaxID=1424756 RepID=A0ACC2XKC2_9TREE|nr:hypothetical protein QFC22_001103 [Naganishia vaughanmartiniae]
MSFQQSLQATAKTDINEDFEIIDRSALDSSANELADQSVLSPRGSKNLPKDMIGALATSMSSALQLPINPPRKDTPILPTYRHGGSPPMNSVRLETPSPLAAQEHGRIESTAETETGEALSATTEPVLGKAHTTVIESSNRPVGHRSSPSLRHIVFSSRTTSTPGVYPSKEGQEDNNSSTESFVKILPPEGSPDRAGGSVATFASRDRGTSYSQGTARQSDPHDDSELAATLEAEDLTIGRGRSADRQATTHPLPEDLPRTPDSDMASSPESSVFVHGILPAISSPSLSFLIDSRSTTSSVASSDNLARSYNSAEDPNNLKYWWEAGIRDGDPVGSPLHRYSPPSRQSSNALGNESRGISSPASIDQIARMSTSQAIAQAQEHDCRDQAISQDSTIVRPLPVRRESKPDAGQQMSKSDSDESVEQGRELKYTLSDDVLFKGKTTVENALLEMPSGEAGVARDEADGVDATGGPTPWLEPLGMLLHEAPDLQVDVSLSGRSLNANVSSDFHSCGSKQYELRPWDPMVNGAYITFKFLLYLLANTLRCQPNQLPYLPITSYIAKFAMVPELDLRRLFSNELSYAVVADHHLTHHELFLYVPVIQFLFPFIIIVCTQF